jgi:hypothetical protein
MRRHKTKSIYDRLQIEKRSDADERDNGTQNPGCPGTRFQRIGVSLEGKTAESRDDFPRLVRSILFSSGFPLFHFFDFVGAERFGRPHLRLVDGFDGDLRQRLKFLRIKPNEVARLASFELKRRVIPEELKHVPIAVRAFALAPGGGVPDFAQQILREAFADGAAHLRHSHCATATLVARKINPLPLPNGDQVYLATWTKRHEGMLAAAWIWLNYNARRLIVIVN